MCVCFEICLLASLACSLNQKKKSEFPRETHGAFLFGSHTVVACHRASDEPWTRRVAPRPAVACTAQPCQAKQTMRAVSHVIGTYQVASASAWCCLKARAKLLHWYETSTIEDRLVYLMQVRGTSKTRMGKNAKKVLGACNLCKTLARTQAAARRCVQGPRPGPAEALQGPRPHSGGRARLQSACLDRHPQSRSIWG